jgi:crossover junction endodeoxyribonuclease RuvC
MTALSDVIIAGIDPGKTGAMAILYPDNSVHFFDVPTVKLKGRDRPAWKQWDREWRSALDFAGVGLVVIEDVAARPKQGVTSMFTFGRTLGFAHAIATSTDAIIEMVTPIVWKGKMGLLKSSKGASREKATVLLPSTVGRVSRVKDDGRAEAALLALYGRKYL